LVKELSKQKTENEILKDISQKAKVNTVGRLGKYLVDRISDPSIYELELEKKKY
jgi:hypothetical protein